MQAAVEKKQIMVTLKNGKIYIGYVVGGITRKENAKWLQLLPSYSGYRDKENLTLNITVSYTAIIEKIEETDTTFDITLPVNEITSLQFFDHNYYHKHFKANM